MVTNQDKEVRNPPFCAGFVLLGGEGLLALGYLLTG
jgi:hypothetical protein